MPWRPHPKHATVDPTNPRAWGTCDRSGFIFNHEELEREYQWAGTTLQDQHILVGSPYSDVPSEFLRAIKLPPDPDPIINARPEPYGIDEGAMPLTTEPGYPGDPGQVLRDPATGQYIGVDADTTTAPSSEGTFVLDHSSPDTEDDLTP